ncbi:MAG TPA: peptidase T [Candidatus Coprenecus stercoripullorum]|nr:peptidase T [Candidatus Coprenecus stercoripullorum]
MEKIIDRFLRYISFDTSSNPDSQTQPSTNKQFFLLDKLREELEGMGLEDVTLDQYGYLMASIPSNIGGAEGEDIPAIGFIAHVDTSPDASGANIKPNIIENYDGKDIVLNKERNMVLKVSEFPELAGYKGQTIITADGTTLLGADDKAGVAEIMSAVEYMVTHPEFRHGEIKIGFTPDEEIGRGVDRFDVERFGAKYAYTMDGGAIGELEYENFNAASAAVRIQGRNIHPGYAKDKMLNAILIGSELNDMLPVWQRPEHTEGYDGFIHIIKFAGVVEEATINYIIRDHDMELFEKKKRMLEECAAFINGKYGDGVATVEIKDQYYNMKKEVEPHYRIIEIAVKAMEEAGIRPEIKPIRGGTDGARLSFMGLPCPNIFAGGHNFHGKYEYVPVQSMEKATEVILNIIKNFTLK